MTEVYFGQWLAGYIVSGYRQSDGRLVAVGVWPPDDADAHEYLVFPIDNITVTRTSIMAQATTYRGSPLGRITKLSVLRLPIDEDKAEFHLRVHAAIKEAGWVAAADEILDTPVAPSQLPVGSGSSGGGGGGIRPPGPSRRTGPWSEYGLGNEDDGDDDDEEEAPEIGRYGPQL